MRDDNMKAAVELSTFLYNREGDERTNAESVVFFDQNGIRYEKHISKVVIEEALGKVDCKPKSIERSSGGVIRCQPNKLLVYSNFCKKGDAHSEVRVRVRFLDFIRDSTAPLSQEKYAILTKDVLPSEINENFTYSLDKNAEKFVVDFGFGIVPVLVFDYIKDKHGHTNALFVSPYKVNKTSSGQIGKETPIQAYKASRSVLRVATKSEYDIAVQRSKQLHSMGEHVYPLCLKYGTKLLVPRGFPSPIMRDILCRTYQPYLKKKPEDNIFSYMDGV